MFSIPTDLDCPGHLESQSPSPGIHSPNGELREICFLLRTLLLLDRALHMGNGEVVAYQLTVQFYFTETQKERERESCFCSFAKLQLTFCDLIDCSTPGFPVLHYLLEFAQTHVR